jgi:hypothetical protein
MQRITINIDVSDEVAAALPERVAQVMEEDTQILGGITYRAMRPKFTGENAVTDCLAEQVQRFVQQLVPDLILPQSAAEAVSRDYQAAMEAMRAARASQLIAVSLSTDRGGFGRRKPIEIEPVPTEPEPPKEEA